MTDIAPTSADAQAIDICLCTFRRPHVAETLKSLARLTFLPGWAIRIIVADNDETPSARELVEATARENALNLVYIHAPARNISIARNACLNAATAPLVAFIDDDEIAGESWLIDLVATLNKYNADVALGQVQAVYGPECPDWMKQGDFHSIRPVWVNDKIITGYTCNVLLRAKSKTLEGLRFREEFGRSGGEDTVFFAMVHKNGGHIVYAPGAIVKERVAANRASFSWLLKRWFRSGQTHGVLLLEKNDTSLPIRLKNITIALAKAIFCWLAALLHVTRGDRLRYWILRGTMHAGVMFRLLGQREFQQYG